MSRARDNSKTARLLYELYATYLGAAFDGVTDDTAFINSILTTASAHGRGDIVGLRYGKAMSKGVTIPNGMFLDGRGQKQTLLENVDPDTAGFVVESEGFDTLTGTNAWFTSEGVPSFFGIRSLGVYGGKRPPTVSTEDRGNIRLYGKSITMRDIMSFNCDGVGLITECGDQTGQTEEYDMPEGDSGNIKIKRSGGTGWIDKGPHDHVVWSTQIAEAGYAEVASPTGSLYGYEMRKSAGVYVGHGERVLMHIYGTKGSGIKINHAIHSAMMISESNTHLDVIFSSTAQNCYVGWLQTYGSAGDGGTEPSIDIEAGAVSINIGLWQSTGATTAQYGMRNAGRSVQSGISAKFAAGKTGYGLKDSGENSRFHGHIEGWSGTGGRGVDLDDASYSNYDLILRNCKAALAMSNDIRGVMFKAVVQLVAGQQVMDSTTQAFLLALGDVARRSNSFHIRGQIANDAVASASKEISATLDVTTVGLKTVVLNHPWPLVPVSRDCVVSLDFNGDTAPAYVIPMWGFLSATSTTVTLQYLVTTADASPPISPRLVVHGGIPGGI